MRIQKALELIFQEYAIEKKALAVQFAENRRFNASLKAGEVEGKRYPEDKRSIAVSGYPMASLITRELPVLIDQGANISNRDYKIKGSVGQGGIAEIPWICIFDRDITISAEEGYYIVLLFTADSKGVYLSLNQGCTQYYNFVKETGRKKKDALKMLRENAKAAQRILRSVFDFDFAPISLGAQDELGLGYEAGNICSKYYSLRNLPTDSEFIDDLRNLLGVYRELKGLVGRNIMQIEEVSSEEGYQEKVQLGHHKQLKEGPIEKKTRSKASVSSAFSRDPNMAYMALETAGFVCECDPQHETFISEKSGKNFVEAHHLIPMEFQGEYENSIDVPENIISLCPNCHRAFHNAQKSQKLELIQRFFLSRQKLLQNRGINTTVERLFEHYRTEAFENADPLAM